MFGRKRHREPGLVVSRSTLGKLDRRQVPARLRVIAVTPPSEPQSAEAALISGMLLGPFPLEIVQFTVALAKELWPESGQELAAVADPANPLVFAVVWGTGDGASEGPVGEGTGWDPGPGGTHLWAAAAYLAEAGFFPDDFGPGLDAAAPGMSALLAEECARYVTVIPGELAVSLAHTGAPAQGVVVQARKLSLPEPLMPNPDACMAWVTLDVTPAEGTPYRTTIRSGFRSAGRFAALAMPGTHLPLRYNPRDRAQVTLDRPAMGITPL